MSTRYERRAVTAGDAPIVEQIFASSREADLALVPLVGEQLDHFVSMQCRAQLISYDSQFPEADHDLIVVEGETAGRIIVDTSAMRIHIVDIALLPAFRGRGIGSLIIEDLQRACALQPTPLVLKVALANDRAIGLYERVGFIEQARDDVYATMQWSPSP